MFIRSLHLSDYRSWQTLDLDMTPGVTVLVGPNGHGKTNVVEALGYLTHLGSHRVNTDSALVRQGCELATINATAVNNGRELTAGMVIRARGANKGFINRSAMPAARDIVGIVRTTLFSPEDLALVRGEPEQRRQFLDALMVARYPRLAAVKSDYDKALKQRNALLRQSAFLLRLATNKSYGRMGVSAADREAAESALSTLDVWDGQLAHLGGQIISARVQIVHDLFPHLQETYQSLAPDSRPAHMAYTSTINEVLRDVGITLGVTDPDAVPGLVSSEVAEAALLQGFADKRSQEVDRGTTLLGPHRDDLILMLGTQPAKGFASHGESWSVALSLRLAAFFMGKRDGMEPVVILDDVFAELDVSRRKRLVEVLGSVEQVIITAAVLDDIPSQLKDSATIIRVVAQVTDEGRISGVVAAEDAQPGAAEQVDES